MLLSATVVMLVVCVVAKTVVGLLFGVIYTVAATTPVLTCPVVGHFVGLRSPGAIVTLEVVNGSVGATSAAYCAALTTVELTMAFASP